MGCTIPMYLDPIDPPHGWMHAHDRGLGMEGLGRMGGWEWRGVQGVLVSLGGQAPAFPCCCATYSEMIHRGLVIRRSRRRPCMYGFTCITYRRHGVSSRKLPKSSQGVYFQPVVHAYAGTIWKLVT